MKPGSHRLTFAQHAHYAAALVVARVLGGLPLSAAVFLGRAAGRAFHRCDGRHRRRVEEQAGRALGLDPPEARRLARRMYDHFGTMLAEFAHLPRLRAADLARTVDWRGGDALIRSLLAEGKGLVFATGHIGNWEAAGYIMHLAGFSAGAVARPLDNPLLDRMVNRLRTARGQEIWDKFGALRRVLRLLREGKGVGLLVDQDAGQRGLMVPFFGAPASTMPTPADLALRTGAPVLVSCLHRTGAPMRFELHWHEPIRARPGADPAGERLRILGEMNRGLEAFIRRRPEQWLWLHRRWKTREIFS